MTPTKMINEESVLFKYYKNAKELARERKKISASFFVRSLDIGYAQAFLIIEEMEREGFDKEIYPHDGYAGEQQRLARQVLNNNE
jgi:DNA segregation ATPase FtsK/SpoIIIE-like protein